jgi:hypothetical protein
MAYRDTVLDAVVRGFCSNIPNFEFVKDSVYHSRVQACIPWATVGCPGYSGCIGLRSAEEHDRIGTLALEKLSRLEVATRGYTVVMSSADAFLIQAHESSKSGIRVLGYLTQPETQVQALPFMGEAQVCDTTKAILWIQELTGEYLNPNNDVAGILK